MFDLIERLKSNKLKNGIFLVFSFLMFVLSQYSILDYYFIHKQQAYFDFVYFGILAMFFMVGFLKKSNYFYLIAVMFIAVAWYSSYSGDKTKNLIFPFIFYSLFSLFFFMGYTYSKRNSGEERLNETPHGEIIVYWLAVILAVVAAVFHPVISDFFLEQTHVTSNIHFLHYLKQDSIRKFFSVNQRILMLQVLFIVVVLIYIKMYSVFKRKNEFLVVITIFLTAFTAKILAIYVYDWFKTLEVLMNNPNVMDYYVYTHGLTNFMDFLKDYKLYQTGEFGVAIHLRSHPPLMAFLYWIMCRASDCAPLSVAMLVILLTTVSAPLIYYLIREYTGNKDMAFAGGMLYAVSANNILQSRGYSDSVQVLAFALLVLLLLIASRKRNLLRFCAAGIMFGISTYLNFSAWLQIILIFPLFFRDYGFRLNYWARAVLNFIVFVVGVGLLHFAFYALSGFSYNYIESYKLGTSTMGDTIGYPYTTWWWANGIHWIKYIGSGIFALWLASYIFVLKGVKKMDIFLLMSATSIIIFLFSCVVMGQIAWKFMYVPVLILPVAAAMLGKTSEKNWVLNARLTMIIIFITYLEVMIYNAVLVDPQ